MDPIVVDQYDFYKNNVEPKLDAAAFDIYKGDTFSLGVTLLRFLKIDT